MAGWAVAGWALAFAAAAAESPSPPAADADWNALFRLHYAQRVRAFREQNALLQHVVLLGDSLTEGFDPVVYFPQRRVLNRGIGGDVLGVDLPNDDPRGVLKRLDESVFGCQPTDVFVMIGVNDLNQGRGPDTVERGYRLLIAAVQREQPRTRLHVQSLLPTRGVHADKNPLILECNRRLAALAAELRVNYIDLHSLCCDEHGALRPDFTDDGLHLTPAAYAVWQRKINEVLHQDQAAHGR